MKKLFFIFVTSIILVMVRSHIQAQEFSSEASSEKEVTAVTETKTAETGEVAAASSDEKGQAPLTAQQVLEKVENRYIGKTSQASMAMILEGGGATKNRTLILYRSKEDNKNQNTFIHFLSPADIQNTTYLIREENGIKKKWIYLPSFKKIRQIVSKDNTTSFVSSDFTYEDLDPIHADEYECSNLTEEIYKNEPVWCFEARKKNQTDSGYSKAIMKVSKKSEIPLLIELYDKKSGRHIKTLENSGIKKVKNIWTIYKSVMSDLVNNTKTTLELKAIDYDLALPPETFTERNMEK